MIQWDRSYYFVQTVVFIYKGGGGGGGVAIIMLVRSRHSRTVVIIRLTTLLLMLLFLFFNQLQTIGVCTHDLYERHRERGRGGGRERQTGRQRQRDKQTDRQTDRQTETESERRKADSILYDFFACRAMSLKRQSATQMVSLWRGVLGASGLWTDSDTSHDSADTELRTTRRHGLAQEQDS